MITVANRPLMYTICLHREATLEQRIPAWREWLGAEAAVPLSSDPRWLQILRDGLGHTPYCLEAIAGERTVGLLPLALVHSLLFGRFLVGLPYLNSGGVRASDPAVVAALLDHAVALADELNVKHLELRHESEISHRALTQAMKTKVHMRLALPPSVAALWDSFKPAVRNQVRKGEKHAFRVAWGGKERVTDFYRVFSQNMRDKGTPVFSRRLFDSILQYLSQEAELCVLYAGAEPVAAALLCHGRSITEVPSASSLREFNSTNANMYMYWQLLQRAVERGQQTFDFGRSSVDSNTYRFKKQWGAKPEAAVWQYSVRRGDVGDMRPESPKYRLAIRAWQRLPVWVANLLGPIISRGIP